MLEAGIAAYNRGDFDEALRHFTEDVVWNAPPDFPDVGSGQAGDGMRVSQDAFAVVRTDGPLISRMDYFQTSEEALEAAGLSA